MKLSELNIEELEWEEAKALIWEANPSLATLLEQFEPKYTFFKARYLFNDKILNQGVFHLPLRKGGTIPINSPEIPQRVRRNLCYNYLPLALILNQSVEVYFETDERVMPSKLFTAGTTIGLWEAFDPAPSDFLKKIWNLSAGARTAFMLPKIADGIAHGRLKRDYGISAYPPKKLLDHTQVFTHLAHRVDTKQQWSCDLLLFCNKWLEEDDNLSVMRLHKYWIHEAWRQSLNCRNQMSYDVAWEAFSKEVTRRNLKPRPYIINTIKHLMAIGEGIFPGFTPSRDSDIALPTSLIQEAYMKSYLLKQYAPIIMHPHHVSSIDKPVYYSLSLPTLLEYAPRAENARSIIADMRELKTLMDVLLASTADNKIVYEFFHCDEDRFSGIKNSSEIPKEDKNVLQYPKKYGDLEFASNSPFFRGCIKISKKE